MHGTFWVKTALPLCLTALLSGLPSPGVSQENPPIPAKADSYEKSLDLGFDLLVQEKDDEAEKHFQRALKIRPGDRIAKKALKSIQKRRSHRKSLRKRNRKEKIKEIRNYLKKGHRLVAATTLRTHIDNDPEDSKARSLLKKFIQEMNKELDREPEDSYSYLRNQGILSYLQKDLPEAQALWSQALRIEPEDQILKLALEQMRIQIHPSDPRTIDEQISEKKPASPEIQAPPPQEEVAQKEPEPSPSQSIEQSLSIFLVERTTQTAHLAPSSEKKSTPPPAQDPFSPTDPEPQQFPKPEPLPEPTEKTESNPISPPENKRSEPEKTSPVIAESLDLLSQGEYLLAVNLLKQLLNFQPEHLEGQATLHYALGEQRRAATRRYHQGLLWYASGKSSKAFEEWMAALRIDPNYGKAKEIILKTFFRHY